MNLRLPLLAATLAFTSIALAAEPGATPRGTLIDFRVDLQKSVANDLGRATAFAEANGADPAEVARKVKLAIAEGLATAKAQPGITVKSGTTHTYPVYGKGNRNIESWRMRSEIILESHDAAALSAAVGKLQGTLAVSSLAFAPAPDTRRKAEEEATIEAIEAFRVKAERIAATMRKPYKITQMNLNGSGYFPQPMPAPRAVALMSADAAPIPMEAGESNISVNVSGQIELTD